MSTIIRTEKTFKEIADDLAALESQVKDESLDVKYDPNKIEEEMILEELNKEQNPREMAKLGLEVYYPELCRLIKEFHARELRDLIKCMIEYPYHERHLVDKSSRFKEAVGIANFVVDAKFTLITSEYVTEENKENDNGENSESRSSNEE